METDLKGLVKATVSVITLHYSRWTRSVPTAFQGDFGKRMETLSASIAPTMSILLRQASLRILNTSSIPTLLKRVQKTSRASDNALKLLTFVSKHLPALYKTHVGELVKGVADEKSTRLVEVSLQALAAVARWDETMAPTDKCVWLCIYFGERLLNGL